MARIKIEDLPRNQKISLEEMKKAMGGINMIRRLPSLSPSPMRTSLGGSSIFTLTTGPCIMTMT